MFQTDLIVSLDSLEWQLTHDLKRKGYSATLSLDDATRPIIAVLNDRQEITRHFTLDKGRVIQSTYHD